MSLHGKCVHETICWTDLSQPPCHKLGAHPRPIQNQNKKEICTSVVLGYINVWENKFRVAPESNTPKYSNRAINRTTMIRIGDS